MPSSNVSAVPLSQLDVLVVDCQATGAAPRGRMLEIAWARAGTTITRPRARLIALPSGEGIPPVVTRITGLTESMLHDGVEPHLAWQELVKDAAACAVQPAPTIIHFARFERPFLQTLAGSALPLDIICTHEVARRVFPDLPRRSLRAVAGYLGHGVRGTRRSADHVEATSFVWQALVPRLTEMGVGTWDALRKWLAAPVDSGKRTHRAWPMPRAIRLALPDSPGVYRILRSTGDVLYVGKASSLRDRVNSHFRRQRGIDERALEMLSQAQGISFEVTPTPLEAALVETDEIKRLCPPYNVALGLADRAVSFASRHLDEWSPRPSSCTRGPFLSAETLRQFGALARADRAAMALEPWGPGAATFEAGYERLRSAHRELRRGDVSPHAALLRLGTRLWREGRRDRADATEVDAPEVAGHEPDGQIDAWTPELVQAALERLALRAALARRRALWVTRLMDASVKWCEPGSGRARLIVIEAGEIVAREDVDPHAPPPVPPGAGRSTMARLEFFTVATFDRLRVLTTELKRVTADGEAPAVRFSSAPPLCGDRLRTVLGWV